MRAVVRSLAIFSGVMVCGCASQAHPPVVAQDCYLVTEKHSGQRYVVRYLMELKNTTDKPVRATRVEFPTWSHPQFRNGDFFDYTTTIPPRGSARISPSTSPFHLRDHNGAPITPPPQRSVMVCDVIAARFADGEVWTISPGYGSP